MLDCGPKACIAKLGVLDHVEERFELKTLC